MNIDQCLFPLPCISMPKVGKVVILIFRVMGRSCCVLAKDLLEITRLMFLVS